MAALRGALRDARLGEEKKRDLQATIQAHFKEWLLESGSMRQVYELARIERGGERVVMVYCDMMDVLQYVVYC